MLLKLCFNRNMNETLAGNSSEIPDKGLIDKFIIIVAYISLFNAAFGTIGNLICFIVFISSKELRRMSYVIYLAYCSIMNIFSLFEWNLNHFLTPFYGIGVESANIFNCRFFTFLQYFSLQCSAFLLSWMSIDRFVTVIAVPGSLASRLPFSTTKTAHFWSILTIVILCLINAHILIFNGYFDAPVWLNRTVGSPPNQTVDTYLYQDPNVHCYHYSPTFMMVPLWDIFNMYCYTFVPFIIMMLFNTLLIVKTLLPNKKVKTNTEANREKSRLSRSLLIINMSFLFMNIPVEVAFGYFNQYYSGAEMIFVFNLLDNLSFMHQSVFFLSCLTTNKKFRHKFEKLFLKMFRLLRIRSNRVQAEVRIENALSLSQSILN